MIGLIQRTFIDNIMMKLDQRLELDFIVLINLNNKLSKQYEMKNVVPGAYQTRTIINSIYVRCAHVI